MINCPPTRHHQESCVTRASLRFPNSLPLGNSPGSQTCSQRSPPRIWKSPARHLVSLFSEKRPGCSTTALLLMGFIYSQLPTSSSSPLHSASRRWRLCYPPSLCLLCSWILPLTPPSHHQSLRPAHMQKHTPCSCLGWLVFASPPLRGSQPHKQASLVSYAFFLMFTIP